MLTIGMPKSVIWPQFEDDTPVNIGDYVLNEFGEEVEAKSIRLSYDGCWRISDLIQQAAIFRNGEKCKRPFHDSWKKLENDAQKSTYEYWDCENIPCSLCPSMINEKTPFAYYGCGDCSEASRKDIVARAKKIAEHERNQR